MAIVNNIAESENSEDSTCEKLAESNMCSWIVFVSVRVLHQPSICVVETHCDNPLRSPLYILLDIPESVVNTLYVTLFNDIAL